MGDLFFCKKIKKEESIPCEKQASQSPKAYIHIKTYNKLHLCLIKQILYFKKGGKKQKKNSLYYTPTPDIYSF